MSHALRVPGLDRLLLVQEILAELRKAARGTP